MKSLVYAHTYYIFKFDYTKSSVCETARLQCCGPLGFMTLYFMNYYFCSSHGYGYHAILHHHISDHRAKSNCLISSSIMHGESDFILSWM